MNEGRFLNYNGKMMKTGTSRLQVALPSRVQNRPRRRRSSVPLTGAASFATFSNRSARPRGRAGSACGGWWRSDRLSLRGWRVRFGREPRIGVVKHSAVRTGQLRRLPAVHARPINLVIFQGPSRTAVRRSVDLGGGFVLRCLQRLSGPGIATLRCPERDNRDTSGPSGPILSY